MNKFLSFCALSVFSLSSVAADDRACPMFLDIDEHTYTVEAHTNKFGSFVEEQSYTSWAQTVDLCQVENLEFRGSGAEKRILLHLKSGQRFDLYDLKDVAVVKDFSSKYLYGR